MAHAHSAERHAGGELTLGAVEFGSLAKILHEHSGIVLAESKRTLMAGRLTKRIRALGLSGFGAYAELVARDAVEKRQMIEALTTNHTSFFREKHHFEHFSANVLPQLLTAAKAGRRIRIWSAGCSSGEEPYSIAMCLLSAARAISPIDWLPTADVAILATDLSTAVLEAARAGRYPAAAATGIPQAYHGFFQPVGNEIEMSASLKRLVAFKRLNLLEEWPMRGHFDVIFCRNVMIYFDENTKDRLCRRFVEAMTEGGQLYIGHSERVCGLASNLVQLVGQTAYRRIQ